jgi:peptidoglycan/xylan/chitin deacetylase (PgdA/CDA1 family)
MNNLIRDMLAAGLHRLQITSPARGREERLYIATFHRVLPDELRREYPLPGLAVTPAELEWFVQFFQQSFHCQRLDAAWREFSRGEGCARPRLAITFDDGQRDNFLHAAPVLDRLGVPATFFVPVEAVEVQQLLWHDRVGNALPRLGREHPRSHLLAQLGLDSGQAVQSPQMGVARSKQMTLAERLEWIRQAEALVPNAAPAWDGMMTWTQLRELTARGHEIGCHSYTHPNLVACSDEQLDREIVDSRRRLEQELGAEVRSFCYPNGDYDSRVAGAVCRGGYELAVTTRWGSNSRSAEAFSLKRHDMVSENSLDRRGNLSAPRVAMRMAGFVRGVH